MSDPKDNVTVEDMEEDITSWILETLDELRTEEGFCLKAAMDLPPISRIESEELIHSLESILKQYNIEIPPDIRRELLETPQHEAVFLAPAVHKELRPRTVSINTNAKVRVLFIRGEAPIDGKDGKIIVHFDYSEKPGRLLPDGTIDFRNINKFPQAREGQVLIDVYEPTQGTPGTDVEGGHIPPKVGKAFEVEAGEGIRTERKYDEKEKRYYVSYIAEKAGIVICSFDGDIRDAEHLRKIEIKNQITVRDIDFSTGNIGDAVEEVRCVADVVVEGDIKGSFAVIIDGNLDVRGAVEGEKIDVSGELKASFVRSSVRIGGKAEIGSALNATIRSEDSIVIEREVARCIIEAPTLILQPKGTPTVLIGQLEASVQSLYANGCEIRSKMVVEMGRVLLEELKQLEKRRETLDREIEALQAEIKDRAVVFLQKIKMIKNAIHNSKDKELEYLQALGTRLLKGEIGAREVLDALDGLGSVQNSGNLPIVKSLKAFANSKENEEKFLNELEAIRLQEEGINEKLSRMELIIEGLVRGSGVVEVVCGKERLKWETPPSGEEAPLSIQVKYVPGKGLVTNEL